MSHFWPQGIKISKNTLKNTVLSSKTSLVEQIFIGMDMFLTHQNKAPLEKSQAKQISNSINKTT